MDWKDISGVVGKTAPLLGTLLGGPAGAAVGGIIASVLGTGNNADDVSAALSVNPDAAVKLKEIEATRQTKLAELAEDQAKAEISAAVENTKDARAMQVAVRSQIPGFLALVITVGFFGVLIGMMSGLLKTADNQALLLMLGALGAAWGGVVNYYFGSSAGSARKDEIAAVKK